MQGQRKVSKNVSRETSSKGVEFLDETIKINEVTAWEQADGIITIVTDSKVIKIDRKTSKDIFYILQEFLINS